MPQTLDPQLIFGDVSEGVITKVSHKLAPQNSVSLAVNLVFDENYGDAMTRRGITQKGSDIIASDKTVNGLYNFKKSDGTSILLAVLNDSGDSAGTIAKYTTSWSVPYSSDTKDLKTRFETFLDTCVRLNGTDAVKATTDGSSWGSSSALDTANMPNGKYIKVYKDQVCIAGVSGSPNSVYISSPVNITGNSISWTSGNREIVINPEDGEQITALGEVSGVLLVFKEQSMFRWNNQSTEADTLVSVGCSSQESVTNCGQGVLSFFNQKGIWLTSGDYPQLISRKVQEWIDGMNPSYYTEVSSIGDEEYLYVSIGDCTVQDRTFTNVVIRYSMNTREFSIFSYSKKFSKFSSFKTSTAFQLVGGTTDSAVYQIESSSENDAGDPISYEIQSHEIDFGSRSIKKEISESIVGIFKGLNSAVIQVLVGVEDQEIDWQHLGTNSKQIQIIDTEDQVLLGNYFKFRITGVTEKRGRILGLELPTITLLDYLK